MIFVFSIQVWTHINVDSMFYRVFLTKGVLFLPKGFYIKVCFLTANLSQTLNISSIVYSIFSLFQDCHRGDIIAFI